MRRRVLAVVVPLVLVLILPPPAAAVPAASGAPGAASPPVTVTLVTGDRVTVRPGPDGAPLVAITAAARPGRQVHFATTYTGGSVRVLPSDVAALVPEHLDPALFDVTGLIRAGLDDASSPTLPLIMRSAVGLRAAGRSLPSIGAVAVDLPKDTTTSVASASATIWLDAPVRAAAGRAQARRDERLDRNLTQIGAPAAWAAGLSGAGVRVAVLDTGVDATHPDLAGQVAAAENFTGTPDATDHNGHGTHVASLLAGTGAAAGGARRGVAFGASLLSGKVLDDNGNGRFSDIIAGMEWAAGQGARIVNMSLGSDVPSTGRDPLSLAVDALTASHGVLFVATAGNNGPAAGTVGAPGAADAALTIGAVDRRDRLAPFSARGPRLGDHAVKPDLVAPGVDIVAARAAGTSLGDPVSRLYTRLSGTSMAAPQVAGAAALLAQQRPQWTPAMLKAALTGTATPLPEGAFAAGGGRLDLAAAVPQRTFADPSSVSFGFVSYPQAGLPPVDRTLTVHNGGDGPVTVALGTDLRAPDGRRAPAGMLTVRPARLTVPAHGSATATATLAVALGGAGAFAGAVTVGAVRVPVGVVKESTRHVVRLRAVDRAGRSGSIETLATLINLRDITASPPDPVLLTGGEGTVRVPPGSYTVTAAIPTLGEGEPDPDTSAVVVTSVAIVTLGEVEIDADGEIVLDARTAEPVSVAVPGVQTVPVDLRVFVAAKDRAGNGFVLGYDTSAQDVIEGKLFLTPTAPARHGRLELSTKWRLDTVGGGPTYDLLFAGPAFPVPQFVADAGRLGRVRTTYRVPVTELGYREARFAFTDINPVSVAVLQPLPGPAPQVRTEFVTGGTAQSWFQCTGLLAGEEGVGGYCQAPAVYRSGQQVDQDWLRAPLRTRAGASRTATGLLIGMDDLADDGPHAGTLSGHVFTHRSYALYRNGVLLAEGEDPLGVREVPAGTATFRLTRSLELRPGLMALSGRVESSWTFVSTPPRRDRPPTEAPIVDVAVHVPVDATNRVTPGAVVTVEVSATGRVTGTTLALSTDDGLTWRALDLVRAGRDVFRATVPAGLLAAGDFVSVRTTAADTAGNHTEQTIVRAFAVG